MDFADLTDTPRKQGMLGGTIFFMLVFPIYFGIMGIMNHSGMVDIMSELFVNISNKTTLPIFTFISGGHCLIKVGNYDCLIISLSKKQ